MIIFTHCVDSFKQFFKCECYWTFYIMGNLTQATMADLTFLDPLFSIILCRNWESRIALRIKVDSRLIHWWNNFWLINRVAWLITDRLTVWMVDWLTGELLNLLTDWLTFSMVDRWTDGLTDICWCNCNFLLFFSKLPVQLSHR